MPTIKENLLRAIDILAAVPDEMINLREYAHPCGTHFCAAGVLAQHAFFYDQLRVPSHSLSNKAHWIANAAFMWGDSPGRLFDTRAEDGASAPYDDELLAQHGPMSDKQLALARLFHALKAEK